MLSRQFTTECRPLLRAAVLFLILGQVSAVFAARVVGPWVPIFAGIEHSVSTNTPGANSFEHLQVVHALRIDLLDPGVQLLATPRIANYQSGVRETAGYKVKDFLKNHRLQAAINANFFNPTDYYLPSGTPMALSGLAISQGVVVSSQGSSADSAVIRFTEANQASIVYTNWPPSSTKGIYNAVSGTYPLVVQGVNAGYQYRSSGDQIHQANPRTAYGLSKDRRYLFLLTIDGRQPGYSEGAYDYETAGWLLLLGAFDGVNMDGGGSSTLVVQGSTGLPVELNHSNAVADSGNERTVGSHLGIFAHPLRSFINDVVAFPDDTAAGITWSTVSPSSTQVEYGLTTNFTDFSTLASAAVTNHSALLTQLEPGREYFFRIIAISLGQTNTSPNLTFTTTNYLRTNQLFGLDGIWRFTADNLDGIDWTAPNFDDSTWMGPGPGLLWVDARSTGPNPLVAPKAQELPTDPNNSSYPFITYYFRKHFQVTNAAPRTSLAFSAFVDDGAVFYINGTEAYRLRMDPAASPILNADLSIGYPCNGDATCSDDFSIGPDLGAQLSDGDNTLAVEVHNYNQLSPDTTFGTTLSITTPNAQSPSLAFTYATNTLTLNWSRNGFALQAAASPGGPWNDLPGPVVAGPVVPPISTSTLFYRLRR